MSCSGSCSVSVQISISWTSNFGSKLQAQAASIPAYLDILYSRFWRMAALQLLIIWERLLSSGSVHLDVA